MRKITNFIKFIFTLFLIIFCFSTFLYAQQNTESIISKLKSDDKNKILEGISDAEFSNPTIEIFIELKTLITKIEDTDIRISAIRVVGLYSVKLNNSSIIPTLWDIVKSKTNADVVEQCYKTMSMILPFVGGFSSNEVNSIDGILKSYKDNESQAKASGIIFFATIINIFRRADLIKNLADYLNTADSYILLETARAYSLLYSIFTINMPANKIFTQAELQVGASLLARNLSNEDIMVKVYVVRSLGNCQYQNKDTTIKLISMLKSEDTLVKKECAIALGKIGNPLAVEPLYQYAIDDRNKDIQAAALEGLSYIPSKVDLNKISFLKDDVDYKIRENFYKIVVAVIKATKNKDLLKYLDYAVNRKDWGGSLVQAALGYGEIPRKENLPYLDKLLNFEEGNYNAFVRIAAIQSLAKHKFKESETLLLKRIEVERNPDVVISLLSNLGELGYESSLDAIAKKFTDNNEDIVKVALNSTSKIGGEKAKSLLLDYIKKNPNAKGYDIAITILQEKMKMDRDTLLKETNPAKYYYELAFRLFKKTETITNIAQKKKNYESIIVYLDSSLSYNPNYAEAYYMRGACYYYLEQYQNAITDLEKSIKLGIGDNGVYKAIGIVYFGLGNYDKALEYFINYLKLTNESDVGIHLLIAKTYASKGEFDKALGSVNAYLLTKPDDPDGTRTLADIYHLKMDWEKAIHFMEKYLKLRPNDVEAKYQLGIDYLNNDNFDKSIDILLRVISEVQSAYPRAYYFVGVAYLRKTEYQNAKTYLTYFLRVADQVKDAAFIERANDFIKNINQILENS